MDLKGSPSPTLSSWIKWNVEKVRTIVTPNSVLIPKTSFHINKGRNRKANALMKSCYKAALVYLGSLLCTLFQYLK